MSIGLTKYQKQGLGAALAGANYEPGDFVYSEEFDEKFSKEYAILTNRETSDLFSIRRANDSNSSYYTKVSEPGTTRMHTYGPMSWNSVEENLLNWANEVKLESDAVDPWEQKAEDLANDDSYFTLDELPKVETAIENSLNDLKERALAQGKTLKQIEGSLNEARQILQKAARNSKKSEWMSIFKGIIIGKLVDWGMGTELYQNILHTLINSSQDIAQLAEHASRHIP